MAILGAGHIAAKMARTLKALSSRAEDELREICYAVASRDIVKAKAFASEHGFTKAYGSYEQMLSDPAVELVYVATPHSLHHSHVRMCLEAGKNVLCEKPFMTTAGEAEDVIELAREKGLLVAEAAWPRYTPFSLQIKKMLDDGIIGKPQSMMASLGYPIKDVERIIRPELGGGALLDMGVYGIHFAFMNFGQDISRVSSDAVMSDTGVDLQNAVTLVYNDGKMAQLHSTAMACNERRGIINGEKASMIIDNISNPLKAEVYSGRHELIAEYRAEEQITGFEYQVLSCIRAIRQGKCEPDELPHDEILSVMRMMDSLRKQWGVRFPSDI